MASDTNHQPETPLAWQTPQLERLPRSTYAPAVLGLGITFVFWGFMTTFYISGVGLILCAMALTQWIGELRREP
jgi:hypothetical protein